MTNIEKYDRVFMDVFGVREEELPNCNSKSMENWTSLNLMRLIVKLEREFDIIFDYSAAEEFDSYEAGKKVLREYCISVE